jgi:hypothetical protein
LKHRYCGKQGELKTPPKCGVLVLCNLFGVVERQQALDWLLGEQVVIRHALQDALQIGEETGRRITEIRALS